MSVRARWLEMTGTALTGLRRSTRPRPRLRYDQEWRPPDCGERYHEAITWVGEVPVAIRGVGDQRRFADRLPTLLTDPDWPEQCARCDYLFHIRDAWQDVLEPLYTDGGRVYLLSNEHNPPHAPPAPDGSIWDGWWLPREWHGPDRRTLVIRCPGGELFMPDRPVTADVSYKLYGPRQRVYSAAFTYRWQRDGDPRSGRVTVHPEFEVGQPGRPGHWYGRLIDGEFRPG